MGSLVFIGFMGAGKSGAARIAARELGTKPVDTDALIVEQIGMPIEQFFKTHGEHQFRRVEEEVVCEVLKKEQRQVVALGGGATGSAKVREALKGHTVIFLEVDADIALRRIKGKGRPLAADPKAFRQLHSSRQEIYEQCADVFIPCGGRDVIYRALKHITEFKATAPSGCKLLWAQSRSGDYPVYIGNGLLKSGFLPQQGRRFLITDNSVASLYGELIQHHALFSFPSGESSKTLATAEQIWTFLVDSGTTRSDQLVALGGGVVGDITGFCAATFQRGMDVVQVPTTVVAQVDSAYGGKTGVDLPQAKNYVGAYHQPSAVLVDPQLLTSLPAAELAAGYAEVVKSALIAGGPLWESISTGEPIDLTTVARCARMKLSVVASDERDSGARQMLNLGHTVAHAAETVTNYRQYRHGEAVAVGLLAALRLSEQDELYDQVEQLLETANLPTRFEGVDPQQIVAATVRDKKRTGSFTPFVVVDRPGSVRTGVKINQDRLLKVVKEHCR